MIDVRELILARILVVITTVSSDDPSATVARNRGLAKNDSRPIFILLDGDEAARLTGDRRGRVRVSPTLMTMRPQIFIVLKDKLPLNEGIGPLLNSYRLRLIAALSQDTELLSLIGSNGDIAYIGTDTDLKTGSGVAGQALLNFAITYVLDPYQI